MNREEAKKVSDAFDTIENFGSVEKLIPNRKFIKAFGEGKIVKMEGLEYEKFEFTNQSPNFYEIVNEPQYVPFTKDDWKELHLKAITQKIEELNLIETILGFDYHGVKTNCNYYTFDFLLDNFIFTDNTPCGKLINT